MSSGGNVSTWTRWSGLGEILSNDIVENHSFAPMAKGSACPASGSTWLRFCQVFRAEVKGISKYDFLKRKHVLRDQESKILGRAASSAEIVILLSNSPIHFNTSSNSTEDNARLGTLLQHFSYLLLLPRYLSTILCQCILSTFCPILN